MSEERTVKVFFVEGDYSNVELGYAKDLAEDAAGAGKAFHQGLMIEGYYLPRVLLSNLDTELTTLKETFPDAVIEYIADFNIITINSIQRQ